MKSITNSLITYKYKQDHLNCNNITNVGFLKKVKTSDVNQNMYQQVIQLEYSGCKPQIQINRLSICYDTDLFSFMRN